MDTFCEISTEDVLDEAGQVTELLLALEERVDLEYLINYLRDQVTRQLARPHHVQCSFCPGHASGRISSVASILCVVMSRASFSRAASRA